jgi:hypothetical protein
MPLSGSNVFVWCPLVSPISLPLFTLSFPLSPSRSRVQQLSLPSLYPLSGLGTTWQRYVSHSHCIPVAHLFFAFGKTKSSVPARALVFSPPRPFCLRMLSLSGFRFVCSRDRYSFLLICDHPLAPPISCVRLEWTLSGQVHILFFLSSRSSSAFGVLCLLGEFGFGGMLILVSFWGFGPRG